MPAQIKQNMMEDTVMCDAVGLSEMGGEYRCRYPVPEDPRERGNTALVWNYLVPEESRAGNIDLVLWVKRSDTGESKERGKQLVWNYPGAEESKGRGM